jgi:hypothetical protein
MEPSLFWRADNRGGAPGHPWEKLDVDSIVSIGLERRQANKTFHNLGGS